MRSSEIPAVLQKLFTPKPSRDVVDLCYATNMIQVGLDVATPEPMSIVGQPKGASEYIQASSRVGRGNDKPGLVITNYNPVQATGQVAFRGLPVFSRERLSPRRADECYPVLDSRLRPRHPCACSHVCPLHFPI